MVQLYQDIFSHPNINDQFDIGSSLKQSLKPLLPDIRRNKSNFTIKATPKMTMQKFNSVQNKTGTISINQENVENLNFEKSGKVFSSSNERVCEKKINEHFVYNKNNSNAINASTKNHCLRLQGKHQDNLESSSQFIFRAQRNTTPGLKDTTDRYILLKRANPIVSYDSDEDEPSQSSFSLFSLSFDDGNRRSRPFSSKRVKLLWGEDSLDSLDSSS